MTEQLLAEIEVLKNKLAEWEKKKADGLLIELPVPIGTEVWLATADEPYAQVITRHQISLLIDWWGTYMFATKEEAEQRLKEIQCDR